MPQAARSDIVHPELDRRLTRFICVLPVLFSTLLFLGPSTLEIFRAQSVLLMLPTCLLGLSRSSPPFQRLRNQLHWLLPLILIGAGYALGIIVSSQTAPAIVRSLELLIVVMYGYSLYRESQRDSQLHRFILAAIVIAYGFSLSRFAAVWLLLDDPRSHPWHIAAPGYFHLRNLGFIAAPSIIIVGDAIRRVWASSSHRGLMLTGLCLVHLAAWTGLLWSGSRAGTLCTIIGMTVVALHCLLTRRFAAVALFAVIFLLAAAISHAFLPDQNGFGIMRMVQDSQLGEQSASQVTSGRPALWLNVWGHLQQTPWLGLGPDQYQHQDGLRLRIFEVHNLWLQSWAEGGLLALAGVLSLTLVAAWKLVPALFGPNYICPLILLLYFLYGLVDGVSFWPLSLVIIASLVAGLRLERHYDSAIDSSRPAIQTPKVLRVFSGSIILFAAVIFGSVAYLSWSYTSAPALPDSPTSKLVRQFPVYTYGYEHWIEFWYRNLERDVEEDYRWFTEHSRTPFYARIQLALYLAEQQNFAEALVALDHGIATAPADFLNRNGEAYDALRNELQKRIPDENE